MGETSTAYYHGCEQVFLAPLVRKVSRYESLHRLVEIRDVILMIIESADLWLGLCLSRLFITTLDRCHRARWALAYYPTIEVFFEEALSCRQGEARKVRFLCCWRRDPLVLTTIDHIMGYLVVHRWSEALLRPLDVQLLPKRKDLGPNLDGFRYWS